VQHPGVVQGQVRDVREQRLTGGGHEQGGAAVLRDELDGVVGGDDALVVTEDLAQHLRGGRNSGRPQVTVGAV
jgi:hypothetical protein